MNRAATTLPPLRLATAGLLGPLALANGITVSTLYWGQAVVSRAAADFGPSIMVSLMPGATLLGYAAGVALQAAVAGDLTAPRALAWHFAGLVAALSVAAMAPAPALMALACLFIGLGCSLTQRLLTVATTYVAPERRAPTIGWIIAAGLCGIVLARACVPEAAALIGWRAVFLGDAVLVGAAGVAAVAVSARGFQQTRAATAVPLPPAASLWRAEPTLRRAALQQAVVFACFNLGWAVFPHLVHGLGPWPSLVMGLVALLGAGAALVSGRVCGRLGAGRVAGAGFAGVAAATAVLGLSQAVPAAVIPAMVILDSGTQVALVANQARAQSLASTPAMRGRLAAIVTTIGFAGGAAGAAVGNCLAAWL